MELKKKLFWISVLYFAEGFPFGVAYDVWPVYFRQHGVDLKSIGLMSLLFLPYTLKAAWAPLVDRFGSRQSWIASCEVLLGIACLVMTAFDPARVGASPLIFILAAFTILSATQDVAIDGYAVDVATERDSGAINGIRVSAYRVGLLGSGTLLLLLVRPIGWTGVLVVAALTCFGMAAATFASPRVPREAAGPTVGGAGAGSVVSLSVRRGAILVVALALLAIAWWRSFEGLWLTLALVSGTLALGSFLDPALLRWAVTPRMLPILAFGLLYKVGDSALGRMVKPFWVDRGLTPEEIGIVSGGVGIGLTILGALAGGWVVARLGLFLSLLYLGLAQCVSNFGYVAVAFFDLGRSGIYSASMLESFCQGLGTTAFLSFLMSQCDKEHGATQFALLSASFALSRDIVGAFSGLGVERWGYATYFAATALLALPALALLPFLRSRITARA